MRWHRAGLMSEDACAQAQGYRFQLMRVDARRAAACRRGDVAVAAKHRVGLQPLTVTVHLLDLVPSPGLP